MSATRNMAVHKHLSKTKYSIQSLFYQHCLTGSEVIIFRSSLTDICSLTINQDLYFTVQYYTRAEVELSYWTAKS